MSKIDDAIRGALSEEDAEFLARFEREPNLLVHTAWDLGVGDATAIWFWQRLRREIRVIDYEEAAGAGLDHYARLLQAKGYAYGEHVLPHDARVQELGSGKTRVETLTALGIRPRVLSAHRVEDGINAVRLLLPRCWFDAEKCARGLEALRTRFGRQRTLVVDLDQEMNGVHVANAEIARREGPRVWLRFDREATTAAALIVDVAARYRIRDLTVEEPEIEGVIRDIYQNGSVA